MINKKVKFFSDMRLRGEGNIVDSFLRDGNTMYLVKITKCDRKMYNDSNAIIIYPTEVIAILD